MTTLEYTGSCSFYLNYNKNYSHHSVNIFYVPGILSGDLILIALLHSYHPSFTTEKNGSGSHSWEVAEPWQKLRSLLPRHILFPMQHLNYTEQAGLEFGLDLFPGLWDPSRIYYRIFSCRISTLIPPSPSLPLSLLVFFSSTAILVSGVSSGPKLFLTLNS